MPFGLQTGQSGHAVSPLWQHHRASAVPQTTAVPHVPIKTSIKMSKFGNYVKDSYDELVHKTSWPTFKELQSSAIVVAVAALILAVVVFLMDWVCGINTTGWKGILGIMYNILGH